jgi:hypothetical protein
MSKQKLIGLAAVVALVIAGVVVVQARRPAPAGAVAVSCVLTVPAQVGVNAPFMSLRATKTCTGADPLDVTWVGWTGTTKVQDLWFLNAGAIELPIYDDDPIGVRTWKGQAPTDDPGASPRADEIVFNQPVTDIRVRSRSDVGYSPTPGRTFRIIAERYAYTLDRFVPWAHAEGQVQYRCWNTNGPATPWKSLVNFTSDANGVYEWSDLPSLCPGYSGTQYQVYYPSVQYIFGHASCDAACQNPSGPQDAGDVSLVRRG